MPYMDKDIEYSPREEVNQLAGFTLGHRYHPSHNPIALVRIHFEPDSRYPKGFFFYGEIRDSTRCIRAMYDASELHYKPFESAQEAADAILGWLDNIADFINDR